MEPIGTTLYTYEGHTNAVWAVAWSPDGNSIASASDDETVQVWKATTGSTLCTCLCESSSHTVAWSPDSTRIVAGYYDATIKIWNASTGSLLDNYQGHSEEVSSVSWSPDSHHIASGSTDKTVQVWNVATGKSILSYRHHFDTLECVTWSYNGHLIASSSFGEVHIWEALTGRQVSICRGHSASVRMVSWSPNGRYIAPLVMMSRYEYGMWRQGRPSLVISVIIVLYGLSTGHVTVDTSLLEVMIVRFRSGRQQVEIISLRIRDMPLIGG